MDVEVNHRRWGLAGPSLPGLSPTREVPDDHYDPIRCARPRQLRCSPTGGEKLPGLVLRTFRTSFQLNLPAFGHQDERGAATVTSSGLNRQALQLGGVGDQVQC